eukprot:TRINITY_DN4706_c0_g1_i5.p1 TRINITY_DN4706_c0_g1~~TRINITY_DN4706_c0_g1_i5.p1  ORF type:complete len:537 (-),score=73.86 TRINITY_DN4706_c0_g1_i5:477-2087(-)
MRFLALCCLSLSLLQLVAGQRTTDPAEVEALKAIAEYWDLKSWNFTATDPCDGNAPWSAETANPRLACDCTIYPNNTCHVTHFKVYALDVSGGIPEELFRLTELMDLNLGQNVLSGPIPAEIGRLEKMRYLSLGINNLSGPVPPVLGNLTKLISLSFSSNKFSGPLPKELGNLVSLEQLDLSFNKLTGQIPRSLQDSKSLNFLFLGNNNLSGELPSNIISPVLAAIDVSFNPISGNFPINFAKPGLAMNFLGTSMTMNANGLYDRKAISMFQCLQDSSCANKFPTHSSFSVNCGGPKLASASGIDFYDDSKILGAASLYPSTEYQWVVSNIGSYLSNPNGPTYIETTDSQILGTLESELYKTARISPSSLRYYGLGLRNGVYNVELHFAEIVMDDSKSWKGLGRRIFDIYIQGEKALQNFNIQEEAKGSEIAVIRTFKANVTNGIMEIHFFWSGRGTCCIPYQSSYGPLVSAIHVSLDSSGFGSQSNHDNRLTGEIVGIVVGGAGALLILSFVFYLWWKKDARGHIRVDTDSPRKA